MATSVITCSSCCDSQVVCCRKPQQFCWLGQQHSWHTTLQLRMQQPLKCRQFCAAGRLVQMTSSELWLYMCSLANTDMTGAATLLRWNIVEYAAAQSADC